MNTIEVMEALLATAAGAVDVDRAYLAAGVPWAKDCRSVVVHPALLRTVTPRADAARVPGGDCVRVPAPMVAVTFVADCYPIPVESGRSVKLPSPDAITDWTRAYVRDTDAIWMALLDAAVTGELGECSAVSLDDAQFFGPSGTAAWVTFPVRVALTDPMNVYG